MKGCPWSPDQLETEVVFDHLHELYIVIKRAVSRKHFREAPIGNSSMTSSDYLMSDI